MKIVINKCYGGFGVSEAVYEELGLEWDGYGYLSDTYLREDYDDDENWNAWRAHPDLIKAIEELGTEAASGWMAELRIVDVPNDVDWWLDDYDGIETICEQHRTW